MTNHVPNFTGDAISKVRAAQESLEERSFGKVDEEHDLSDRMY
jgi:hypothetical protein